MTLTDLKTEEGIDDTIYYVQCDCLSGKNRFKSIPQNNTLSHAQFELTTCKKCGGFGRFEISEEQYFSYVRELLSSTEP